MKKRFLVILLALLASPAWAANCFISEYTTLGIDDASNKIPVAEIAQATQTVVYTTSTASAAFATGTRYVRIVCDAKAHFVIATTPTATASSPYLPADVVEYFGVTPGLKIAFYDGTS